MKRALLVLASIALGLVVWWGPWRTRSAPAEAERVSLRETEAERAPELASELAVDAGEEQRVRSAPSPEHEPAPPAVVESGALELRVRDEDGRAVACRVELEGPRGAVVVEVPATGETRRDSLAPGRYVVDVLLESLPAAYVPPLAAPGSRRGAPVEVVVGEVAVLELVVQRACTLSGLVLGPHGEPGTRVAVRATAREGGRRRVPDAETDEAGRYALRLQAGTWRISTFPREERSSVYGVPRPAAVERTLVAGEAATLDFVYAPGPATIAGRVVDQLGEPFAGLHVCCHPEGTASNQSIVVARTDADGRFELAGCPAARLRVHVSDEGTALHGTPDGLSEWVRGVEVDTTERPRADVGEVVAVRAHRFFARGTVADDVFDGPHETLLDVVVPGGRIQREGRADLVESFELASDGTFAFSVPYGRGGAAYLELESRDGESRRWEFQLEVNTETAPYVFALR